MPSILANMITGIIIFNDESYVPERWHIAMWMWAFIVIPIVVNLYLRKVLNVLQIFGGVCHVVFFIASVITLAILAQRSSTDYVFKTLTHDVSGWTNPGLAFGLGLLTMTFPVGGEITMSHHIGIKLIFIGADGLLHMSMKPFGT